MTVPETDLDLLFKRLHLANARRVWRDLVQRAERDNWSYRDFLTLVATEEIAHRQHTRLTRLTRRAHFPFLKTIDDFNFIYQSSVRLNVLGSALSPDFVTDGRSLIFAGKPGRGKTHLAIAIAYRAIQNGFDAYFTTAATLIDDLSAAFRAGELADALPTYTHPNVLVIDEVGYLTYGSDAANLLFHVVNERHRRKRSMIFTTNKSLKAWGRVLHDEDLAHAIIDRVLERGRLLRLDGPSVRTLHVNLDEALNEGSDQGDEVIRISGNQGSKFPEPTYESVNGSRARTLGTFASVCLCHQGMEAPPDLNRRWRFCRQGRDGCLVDSPCFLVGPSFLVLPGVWAVLFPSCSRVSSATSVLRCKRLCFGIYGTEPIRLKIHHQPADVSCHVTVPIPRCEASVHVMSAARELKASI